MPKSLPIIGCCGIACGLCPRFYTDGDSRCPGCGGAGFASKHPPCSLKTCCFDRRGLEVCALCAEFPCPKYEDRGKIERDSFVTHRRIFSNHGMIRAGGLDAFVIELNERIAILEGMLAGYDDGRSKSLYCLAAALMDLPSLRAALLEAASVPDGVKARAKALRAILTASAGLENIALKLIK